MTSMLTSPVSSALQRPAVVPSDTAPSSQRAPSERPRFLSEADCHDIARRLTHFATGGGYTVVQIISAWRGNVRWARNLVNTSGEDRNNRVLVSRNINGAGNMGVIINELTDEALAAAVHRCEEILKRQVPERPESELAPLQEHEAFTAPALFFNATYQLDAGRRAEAARRLASTAAAAGMLSSGYIQVSAHSQAFIGSWGYTRYFQYTWAQCSMTVRDPQGTGSGWAGVDWPDWNKIDAEKLSAVALDKCLRSRNPVAVEPGRYTTILEPQAVCDFVGQLIYGFEMRGELHDETSGNGSDRVFWKRSGYSRIGDRVIDDRITIQVDPMDPELGFPPFNNSRGPIWPYGQLTDEMDEFYHPMTWIDHGVLTNLAYSRNYAISELGRNTSGSNSGAFRMSGGETTVEEMIATTKRGLLVTRFEVQDEVPGPYMFRGYTRDGVWLIEDGKISKAVNNLMFVESVVFALNNVEQLGPPQRAFRPPDNRNALDIPIPVIVPPLKVRDFSFTALSTAV